MRAHVIIPACLALVLLTAPFCRSHGVDGHVEKLDGFCVAARYDDGEPMGYAAVEIRAPGADVVFQTGRTDHNGCFMFRPDRQGLWQAVVQDGMGHRLALSADVGIVSDAAGSAQRAVWRRDGRREQIIAGLSVIFGLTGLLYGWKARRRV